MKLYYSPGACSIGIHVLLEEIGRPYELIPVNLREGGQFKPEFTAVNPKSKVPTLVRDDGSVLTEFPAIAYWLARSAPEKHLFPDDAEAATRALAVMDYAVSTLHMHAFSRLFNQAKYAPTESDHPAVKAKGAEMAAAGFAYLDQQLAGRDYVAGDFSIADAAVFYTEFWGAGRMGMTLPPNVAAHYARMKARPAVARAMAAEGFAA
jgi:glutathione S-transferase